MPQQSSTASPTAGDRCPFLRASCHPRRRSLLPSSTLQICSNVPEALQSTRAGVIAAGHATTAASLTTRETRGARAPSQLTEELHHYAAIAPSPPNDAFLAACLSELSAPHRLRRLRPRQLATLLRSLVRLGAQPGEEWLADVDTCCYCHPGPFDPASATAVLESLAALHNAATLALSNPTTTAGSTAVIPKAAAALQEVESDVCAAFWGEEPSVHKAQYSSHRYRGSSEPRRQPLRQRPYQRWEQHRPGAGSLARVTADPSPASAPSPLPSPSTSTSASAGGGGGDGGAARTACFRFPQAVLLRLLQGGIHSYSYDQLATLLQSLRSLEVALSDEVAVQVGSRMAALLLEMAPEQRQGALAGVLWGAGAAGSGSGGGGEAVGQMWEQR